MRASYRVATSPPGQEKAWRGVSLPFLPPAAKTAPQCVVATPPPLPRAPERPAQPGETGQCTLADYNPVQITYWAAHVADDQDLYRIGTIATLTGIAVERLRAWERRYGLAPAARSGRTRFYNRAQLDQLTRIKQLIDQGHPISSLAGLTTEQLAERVTSPADSNPSATPAARHRPASPARAPRTGLIGPNLLVLELQHERESRLDVRGRWANLDAFLDERAAMEPLDVVVVQMPVLLAHRLDAIAAAQPSARLVALYQFTTPKHLAAVQERSIPTLPWPASWAAIEQACASTAGLPLRGARAAERRFSDGELVAIAASTTDPNRCPAHLVELISSLNAFAEYSANCAESVGADRGAIYQRLHTDTTQARAQLELALAALLEEE
jgi:MerR family transcriptional regulator, light-induced transcriptional regulator